MYIDTRALSLESFYTQGHVFNFFTMTPRHVEARPWVGRSCASRLAIAVPQNQVAMFKRTDEMLGLFMIPVACLQSNIRIIMGMEYVPQKPERSNVPLFNNRGWLATPDSSIRTPQKDA